MNRIAIYGIGGLYNYGCEAIIRGTVKYIKRVYGNDIIITYYSRNYCMDKTVTDEIGINIQNIGRKPSFFRRGISKVIDILRLPIVPFYRKEFENIINNSDIIFSVGGDIYTIPEHERKKNKYRYANYLVEFGEKAIECGKKVVIFGASIGPFGNQDAAIKYYKRHFNRVDMIICRENESVEYLNSLGIRNNVYFLPDPAFLVCGEYTATERKYIGVNLSELSIHELYGKVTNEHILHITELLAEVIKNTDYPLMLIPHVLSPYTSEDNDLEFLSKVFDALPQKIKNRVTLVVPNSFVDAKKYLSQCRIVISARMHCAVNSIIEGTPAIFLAYSQKSIGMAKFIYGNDDWCVPLKCMENELVTVVKDALKNYSTIKKYIDSRNIEIKEIYEDYFRNSQKE